MQGNKSKNPMAGFDKVFGFTFKQVILSKGWLITTILMSVLLALGIPLMLFVIAKVSDPDREKPKDNKAEIAHVLVVDETSGTADYNLLREAGGYAEVDYKAYDSMGRAIAAVEDADHTVILRVTKPESAYVLTVFLPEGSKLSRMKASEFGTYVSGAFSSLLVEKAGLTMEEVMLLSMPVVEKVQSVEKDGVTPQEEASLLEELLGFLLPFIVMMTVYMMVLFYCQSMGNNVMLEKNSKLMETILTAVHPFALMMGKLFATAATAVLQVAIWLACGFVGQLGGVFFALKLIPNTESEVVLTLDQISNSGNLFSIGGILLGLLLLALGFLMYLSLGTVAGALASKAEDLSKTNVVFVIVLVVSMLSCISNPADAAEMEASGDITIISSARILRFIPFTALMINPGELALGKMSIGMGLISAGIMAQTVVLFVALAATIYQMLLLYRGGIPTPKSMLSMLKERKKKSA